jgi:hypothetical protein
MRCSERKHVAVVTDAATVTLPAPADEFVVAAI